MFRAVANAGKGPPCNGLHQELPLMWLQSRAFARGFNFDEGRKTCVGASDQIRCALLGLRPLIDASLDRVHGLRFDHGHEPVLNPTPAKYVVFSFFFGLLILAPRLFGKRRVFLSVLEDRSLDAFFKVVHDGAYFTTVYGNKIKAIAMR